MPPPPQPPPPPGSHFALLLCALAAAAPSASAQVSVAHARTLASQEVQVEGRFGLSVAGVPDVDGDGKGDLLIGAPHEGLAPQGSGRAYVFSGATGGLLHTLHSRHPEVNGGFGRDVAGTPDLDGDGRGDLLVGATTEDVSADGTTYNAAGRVYVFSGATGQHLYTLSSPNPEGGGSFSVPAALPDVDGDGRADVLVGAPGEDVGTAVAAGRAYVFSGASGDLLHTLTSPDPQFAGRFGAGVAGAADVNHDGHGDVLVGAWGEDVLVGGTQFRADAGRAHLFSGATGELLRTLVSPNPERLGYYGGDVAAVEDADGDGVDDFIVAALREDVPGTTDAGRVHLVSGATGTTLHTVIAPSPMATGNFGAAVAGVGDVDGDGRGDFLVGAYVEAGAAGQAHLFSGATGELLATLASPAPAAGGFFGAAVAGVPDTDGDGRDELLVGAPHEGVEEERWAGRVYLLSVLPTTSAEPPSAPQALALTAAPNPSAGPVTLTFSLARPGPLRLAIYDVLGREVVRLLDASVPAGTQSIHLDPQPLAPGLYLARLASEDASRTVRLVLTR